GHLQQLKEQGDAIVAQMNGVASTIDVIQAQEEDVRSQITDTRGRLADLQVQLDERARRAYQNGGGVSLEFLLGSDSLSDLSSRLEIVDRATDSDRELIERVQGVEAELRNRQATSGVGDLTANVFFLGLDDVNRGRDAVHLRDDGVALFLELLEVTKRSFNALFDRLQFGFGRGEVVLGVCCGDVGGK
ncbi:MAG TPA: hypothetical protein VF660_12235, partial [Actinomycetota bacterium]